MPFKNKKTFTFNPNILQLFWCLKKIGILKFSQTAFSKMRKVEASDSLLTFTHPLRNPENPGNLSPFLQENQSTVNLYLNLCRSNNQVWLSMISYHVNCLSPMPWWSSSPTDFWSWCRSWGFKGQYAVFLRKIPAQNRCHFPSFLLQRMCKWRSTVTIQLQLIENCWVRDAFFPASDSAIQIALKLWWGQETSEYIRFWLVFRRCEFSHQ